MANENSNYLAKFNTVNKVVPKGKYENMKRYTGYYCNQVDDVSVSNKLNCNLNLRSKRSNLPTDKENKTVLSTRTQVKFVYSTVKH